MGWTADEGCGRLVVACGMLVIAEVAGNGIKSCELNISPIWTNTVSIVFLYFPKKLLLTPLTALEPMPMLSNMSIRSRPAPVFYNNHESGRAAA